MSDHNATTKRRMTFRPVDPSSKLRPASIPTNTPVAAAQTKPGEWELVVDLDGPADYVITASEEDFELSTQAEEIACVPWCIYGDGHYLGDDAYCVGKDLGIRLSQHEWVDMGDGTEKMDVINVHAEHHHVIAGESGVFIGRGEAAGIHLTDKEALALANCLLRAVDERMPEVIPQ
ncbi:hypothetical protein [Arthrobacter sp. TMN-50]